MPFFKWFTKKSKINFPFVFHLHFARYEHLLFASCGHLLPTCDNRKDITQGEAICCLFCIDYLDFSIEYL
jgi:hypothetical protein